MSAAHTPTPWELVPSTEHHGPYVITQYGSDICDCYTMSNPSALSVRNGGNSRPIHFCGDEADANAAFIVKAVNSHAALVKALKDFVERYCALADSGDYGNWDPEKETFVINARSVLSATKEPEE